MTSCQTDPSHPEFGAVFLWKVCVQSEEELVRAVGSTRSEFASSACYVTGSHSLTSQRELGGAVVPICTAEERGTKHFRSWLEFNQQRCSRELRSIS